MTTRSVHYILTGDEIKAYRMALEIWAESASDSRQEMIKELRKV